MNTIQSFHDDITSLQYIDVLEYLDVIPELKALQNTNQSPVHHPEGNVLNHTKLALDWLFDNVILKFDPPILNNSEKFILYLGVLLHDIAKPHTTFFNEKKQKLVAYGHDKEDAWVAREFLKKYFPELDFNKREQIIALVRHHMEPRQWFEGQVEPVKLKKLSMEVNTKLLYYLSQADTMGRTAVDNSLSMWRLELFKQECENLGVFGKMYQVPCSSWLSKPAYSLARWNILMHEAMENQATYEEADEIIKNAGNPFQIMLLVGAPACGKSTYRENMLKQYPNLQVISMDDRRKEVCGDANDQSRNAEVFQWEIKELKEAMKNKQNTLIDATNFDIKRRKELINIARQAGALIGAVVFDIPLETLLERNSKREKKVPEDVIYKFYKGLEYPTAYEVDQLIIVGDK